MANDPTALARRAKFILIGLLTSEALYALTSLWRIWELSSTDEETRARIAASSVDGPLTFNDIMTLVQLPFLFTASIVVLRWIYVVNRNAQEWSDSVHVSPGWNVGWFFVPVASLWKPYQGIRQTWVASCGSDDPDWMKTWWGLWIASNILGNIGFRWSLKAASAEDLIVGDWINIASLAIDVPLIMLLRRLVTELSACQARRLAERGASG